MAIEGRKSANTSRTAFKLLNGRGSVRSARHEGGKSDSTSYQAGKNIGRGKKPTKTEIDMVFKDNPSAVRVYEGQGFSRQKIYNILKGLD